MTSARLVFTILLILVGLAQGSTAHAHGSVTPDSDLCIIQIGYLRAHFKIYQPETRRQNDYCEDLPDDGRTVFVMEYEHSELGDVPIDVRIIKNVTGKGQFANLEDIQQIADIDAVTVLHHKSAIQRDVFMMEHDFKQTGAFIGIVTVDIPETQKTYTAVFPFEVGYWGLGYWPLIVLAALVLQIHYLWMNGWFRRFRKQAVRGIVTGSFLVMTLVAAQWIGDEARAGGEDTWQSLSGHYEAGFESELNPLVINRIHAWTLTIRDDDGLPVTGASVEISGGMPVHNHGMPTQPRMTRELGGGRYLVEGMRFHMRGEWIVEMRITSEGVSDIVRIPIDL